MHSNWTGRLSQRLKDPKAQRLEGSLASVLGAGFELASQVGSCASARNLATQLRVRTCNPALLHKSQAFRVPFFPLLCSVRSVYIFIYPLYNTCVFRFTLHTPRCIPILNPVLASASLSFLLAMLMAWAACVSKLLSHS